MNILREFIRAKERSVASRVRLIMIFSVILIVNTYAWFNINQDVQLKGLDSADITPWDITYYVDGKEILDQDYTFTIDELYPGMPANQNSPNPCHFLSCGHRPQRLPSAIPDRCDRSSHAR